MGMPETRLDRECEQILRSPASTPDEKRSAQAELARADRLWAGQTGILATATVTTLTAIAVNAPDGLIILLLACGGLTPCLLHAAKRPESPETRRWIRRLAFTIEVGRTAAAGGYLAGIA